MIIDLWSIVEVFAKRDRTLPLSLNIKISVEINFLAIISVIIILALVLSSMIGIKIFLNNKNRSVNKHKGTLRRARRANKLSSEFLLAYILPMIAFDYSNLKNIVLFLIYFIVLAVLCIRNSNVYTNIYLEFLGYKMYYCDIECPVLNGTHIYSDSLMISTYDLTTEVNNDVLYWDFENYIYIILEGEVNNE